MRDISGALALTLVFAVASPAVAQPASPVVLADTEYREFTSSVTQRRYGVFVALPESYQRDATRRYPVVYVSDAHIGFPLTTHIYRLMRLTEDIPELIIIGIAGADARTWAAARFLEFTPTRSESREATAAKSLGLPVRSGDAAGFARVLTAELFPDVAQRYRVTADRVFVGHSLGGLFGVHMLFEAPDVFRGFILVSPALYWDDTVMFRREQRYAAAHRDLRAQVFLAVGELELATMLDNVRRFSSVLTERKYEGLAVQTHVFENETHTSVGPAAITRGLRVLFPEPAVK